jgi:hypothetical protein
LTLSVIANGLPRRVDPARQSRLRNDPTAPDTRNQFVLAGDVVALPDKEMQQVENQRFGSYQIAVAG